MKRELFIIIFLALFLAFPGGYAFAKDISKELSVSSSGKVSKDETWKQFTSSEGRFFALFPSNPTEEVETVDSARGPLNLHIFGVSLEDGTWFSVSYSDYPIATFQPLDVGSLLDGARDGMIANVRGKLISEKPISLGNYPGRELVVEVSKGPFVLVVIARVYIVKNRSYSVQVVILKKLSSSKTVWKFLDSFNITTPPNEPSAHEFIYRGQLANASEYSQKDIEYMRTSFNTILSSAKNLIQTTAIMIVRAEKDGRIPTEINGVESTTKERVEIWDITLRRFQEELAELENKLKRLSSMSEKEIDKLSWDAAKLELAVAGFAFRIGVIVGIQKLVPVE